MSKTILVTGATDGIGLETVKKLCHGGHKVILHGRSQTKLDYALSLLPDHSQVDTVRADLSDLSSVHEMAKIVSNNHSTLDVLINNAGVLKISPARSSDGIDLRFLVNTIAPYLLTKLLLPQLSHSSRVVNIASAAQAPVNLDMLVNSRGELEQMQAYSQSKLAMIMWTNALAKSPAKGLFVSVNPGSLLASKMVKEGFGIAGNDLSIGADILVGAALSEEFEGKSGCYYDNDKQKFAKPHPDGLDQAKIAEFMNWMESYIQNLSH